MAQPRKAAQAAPSSPASRTFSRRCRIAAAGYKVKMPGPDGRIAEVSQWAESGDEIVAAAIEIMRLDSLGALAFPGATREDVEAEAMARIERYQSARQTLPATD